MKKNSYLFSKENKVFTLIHPGKKLSPLLYSSAVNNENLSIGKFTADRIRKEFANSTQLLFEVTDSCNLKCKYCAFGEFYSDFDERKNHNLTFKKAKNLIDYYVNLRKSANYMSYDSELSIGFYGGEPLVNFDLITKIIEYIEKVVPRTRYTATTNGVLLHKYMDYLKEKSFNLLISLDGNEYNDSYRVFHDGTSSFSKVVENVRKFQTKYPEYFSSNVRFNTVLHNRNSVSEAFEFIHREFNKYPFIAEINPNRIREDRKEEFSRTFQNARDSFDEANSCGLFTKEIETLEPKARDISEFLFKFSGNKFHTYNDLFEGQKPLMPTATCAPFSRKIYLTVNGKITFCERIGHQYINGHVNDDKVELDFEEIADKVNAYYQNINKQCSRCGRAEICSVCMYTMPVKDGFPFCDKFTTNKDIFKNYSSEMLSILESKPHLYKHIWE